MSDGPTQNRVEAIAEPTGWNATRAPFGPRRRDREDSLTCAASDLTALDYVAHTESDQIAAAQLAVDGEFQWREFAASRVQL